MGFYIDPATTTKENWLRDHATLISKPPTSASNALDMFVEQFNAERYILVHVDNGAFTALLICVDPREILAVLGDERPMCFYRAKMEDVAKVSPFALYATVEAFDLGRMELVQDRLDELPILKNIKLEDLDGIRRTGFGVK